MRSTPQEVIVKAWAQAKEMEPTDKIRVAWLAFCYIKQWYGVEDEQVPGYRL